MNCFRPSTVIPLLRTPLTVGKRGSSLQNRTTEEMSSPALVSQRTNRTGLTIHPRIPGPRTTWASSWTARCCWGWAWRTPRRGASWAAGHWLSSRTGHLGRGTLWSSGRAWPPPGCPRWGRRSHTWGRLYKNMWYFSKRHAGKCRCPVFLMKVEAWSYHHHAFLCWLFYPKTMEVSTFLQKMCGDSSAER